MLLTIFTGVHLVCPSFCCMMTFWKKPWSIWLQLFMWRSGLYFSEVEQELLCLLVLSYIQLNTCNTKIVGNAKCRVLITNWTGQTLWVIGGSGCESAVMSLGSFFFSHEESRCWHGANRREILSLGCPWVPKLWSVNKVICGDYRWKWCFFFSSKQNIISK